MSFLELGLDAPLVAAVHAAGYVLPTPIQKAAIPPALEGRDVLGCAETGTGKTAAFCLPILQLVHARSGQESLLRALILAPTRELAAQIGESLATYGKELDLWHTVVFGGVSEKPQIAELQRGVDILVATPGRLLDLMGRRLVNLRSVEICVLDEADRMLDMGFIADVRKIGEALPKKRQTLMFSATIPDAIQKLAASFLTRPARVAGAAQSLPQSQIAQSVYFTDKQKKRSLLVDLLKQPEYERTIVFTRTKHGADRVMRHLVKAGSRAAAIHGDKSQGQRLRALEGFKNGEVRVLVATDVAARGIDVDGVTHVINFDLPSVPETYMHRIGRTARAGNTGIAVSFCHDEERPYLSAIEKLTAQRLERITNHRYAEAEPSTPAPAAGPDTRGARPAGRNGAQGNPGRGRFAQGGGGARRGGRSSSGRSSSGRASSGRAQRSTPG